MQLHAIARANPGGVAVCIFEATVLKDAKCLLRLDAAHVPLQLASSACFSATQASGESAHIALQYISVGLGANPLAAHMRLACDYGVAVITTAGAPHAQYPDNMGVWEPLEADEVGGDAYTVHFRVAAYFSLDGGSPAGPVLHVRLNLHPALSRVLPPDTPEQMAREASVFELRQKRYEQKHARSAALKSTLTTEVATLEAQVGNDTAQRAQKNARMQLQRRMQQQRAHSPLQGGLVVLDQWKTPTPRDGVLLRQIRALLLCLAYCPPLVNFSDGFNKQHRVPLTEENPASFKDTHLSVCKKNVTWALSRYVGIARPAKKTRTPTTKTEAHWIFKKSSEAQTPPAVRDRELYATEPSLIQNLTAGCGQDETYTIMRLLNLMLSERSIDEQKDFCPASAEMSALFCQHDLGLHPQQNIAAMHAALLAATQVCHRAPILAVFVIVEFDPSFDAPLLRVGGACYKLGAVVLDIVRTATQSKHAQRRWDDDTNIACIRHVAPSGEATWNIPKKDMSNMVWDPMQVAMSGEDASPHRYNANMLLYHDIFASAAADEGTHVAVSRAAVAMPAAAMLSDSSAQRLATAVMMCVAAAAPLSEYLTRLFASEDDPEVREHMGTFWDMAAAVKTLRLNGTSAVDLACAARLVPPDASSSSPAAFWQALVAPLARNTGMRSLLRYSATYTSQCTSCTVQTSTVHHSDSCEPELQTPAEPAADRCPAAVAALTLATRSWAAPATSCCMCNEALDCTMVRSSLPRVMVLTAPTGFILEQKLNNSSLVPPCSASSAAHTLTGAVFAPSDTEQEYQAWVVWNSSAPNDWHCVGETKVQTFKYVQNLAKQRLCVMLFYSQR